MIRYLSTQLGRLPVELTHGPEGWIVVLVGEHPSLSKIATATGQNPYTALATLEKTIRDLSTTADPASEGSTKRDERPAELNWLDDRRPVRH